MRPSISLFFPAYNEEKNIARSIEQAIAVLSEITDTFEVIVVDDGSRDNTRAVVTAMREANPNVRLVAHEVNKGYGEALKSGMRAATHEYVFFTDADLQFDLSELSLLVPHISTHDAVIGYRKHRKDPFMRLMNARVWNIANRILFGLRVRDIDCAFKLLRRSDLEKITLRSSGAMISAEMLIKLHDAGVSMHEVPVGHFPRKAGSPTGAKPSVILRALREMWDLYSNELGEKTQIQFLKFMATGVLNTLTVIVLYGLLTRTTAYFSEHYLIAETVSYFCGTLVSFAINRHWTFRKWTKTEAQEIFRFYATNLGALIINIEILSILVEVLGVYDLIAVVLAALGTIAWNFLLLKFWVFQKR